MVMINIALCSQHATPETVVQLLANKSSTKHTPVSQRMIKQLKQSYIFVQPLNRTAQNK